MPLSRHRGGRGRAAQRGERTAASLAVSRPRRRRTNKFYLLASVVIAVLVIAGFAIGSVNFGGGGSTVPTGRSEEYVRGVGEQHPIMINTYPNPHVAESESVSYSTAPPTSGIHWSRWSECGFFEDGVPDERITHNLEHGNIVISYNLSSPEEVAQLRDAVESVDLYQHWGLTRLYDKIPVGTVALATWGVLDTMQGVDRERIDAFFTFYAGNLATEQVPCSAGPGQIR